jgi:hypothetical protein
MAHFQVVVTFGDGAHAMFGVEAGNEPAAFAAAHERLSLFIQDAGMIQVMAQPGTAWASG